MKEFLVYTGLRLLLFIAALIIVLGVWSVFSNEAPALWTLILALLLSGIASYFILNRQRDAFARRVEARAAKASAAFEERKAREDAD